MLQLIEKIDHKFFLFVNGNHSEGLDTFFYWITNKYFWIPFYMLLLFFVQKHFAKKRWLVLLSVALMIVASDQGSGLIKNTAERYRPCHNLELQSQVHLIAGCGGQYGFVSSHAANTFALASFFILLFRSRMKWLLFVLFFWASLVSYSRIYAGVHYPLDIFFGAVLGGFLGIIFYTLYFHFSKKIQHE